MAKDYGNHYRLNVRIERTLNGHFKLHLGTDENFAFDSSEIIQSPEKILEKIRSFLFKNLGEKE